MSNWAFPSFPLHAIPVPVSISERERPRDLRLPSHSSLDDNNPSNQSAVPRYDPEEGYQGDDDDVDDDPRNFVRKGRGRPIKTPEENLLHAMIRLFLQEKGFYLSKQALMEGKRLIDANVAAADAYMNRVGPGPSEESPRFAWELSAQHPWNTKVVRILASDFKSYASTTGVDRLVKILGAGKVVGGMIEDYGAALEKVLNIEGVIGDKLADQQRRYRTLVRTMGSLSIGLSETEVMATMKNSFSTLLTTARRNERKRNRFLRRATIISEHLTVPTANAKLWKDLEFIFSHLQEDNMSSDETETEGTFFAGKGIRRVRKFWISDELTKILHFIDGHYNPRTLGGSRKRGSGPLKRELVSLHCNALQPPPPHLPLNFYNTELGDERIKTLVPSPSLEFPKIEAQNSVTLDEEMDAD